MSLCTHLLIELVHMKALLYAFTAKKQDWSVLAEAGYRQTNLLTMACRDNTVTISMLKGTVGLSKQTMPARWSQHNAAHTLTFVERLVSLY